MKIIQNFLDSIEERTLTFILCIPYAVMLVSAILMLARVFPWSFSKGYSAFSAFIIYAVSILIAGTSLANIYTIWYKYRADRTGEIKYYRIVLEQVPHKDKILQGLSKDISKFFVFTLGFSSMLAVSNTYSLHFTASAGFLFLIIFPKELELRIQNNMEDLACWKYLADENNIINFIERYVNTFKMTSTSWEKLSKICSSVWDMLSLEKQSAILTAYPELKILLGAGNQMMDPL